MSAEEQKPVDEIVYLNPADPEDAELLENLDNVAGEVRKAYPTAMDAVEDYRNGVVDSSWLSAGFTPVEMDVIREEAGRRNTSET